MVGERRAAGATHSFRLTITASNIVERCQPFVSYEGRPYPRSLGGKSRLVSDAITWCYGGEEGMRPYDLQKRVEFWVARCNDLEDQLRAKNGEDVPSTPHWRDRISRTLALFGALFRKSA